jgi:hypothetical protein
MEDGRSVPLVCVGTVTHPTTPFGIDPISGEINCDLPVYAGAGTGSFVVNIGGSVCMIEKANSLGINNPLDKVKYDDPVSEMIRNEANTFGQEHLWAINLPGPQTGPWEYWDSTFWKTIPFPLNPALSLHDVAIVTNPDMGFDKANRYIDTSLWFFSPRAYTALKLGELVCSCENVVPDPSFYMINDFECQRNYTFNTGADRLTIIDNPLSNGANNSEKVGAYLEPANDPWAGLCASAGDSIDLSTFSTFMIDVVSPAEGIPFLIKLEGGTSPAKEVWVNTTAAGGWETLAADFSSEVNANHTKICILPNGGVSTPDEVTYLLDNLRLESTIGIFNPVVETLEISPNPVDQILYIRNPGQATHFRLLNLLGQQVKSQRAANQDIVSIIVTDLLPGMYMVGAYDAKGKLIGNARVIKN